VNSYNREGRKERIWAGPVIGALTGCEITPTSLKQVRTTAQKLYLAGYLVRSRISTACIQERWHSPEPARNSWSWRISKRNFIKEGNSALRQKLF
jgi:hypothetical protein